MQQNRKLPQHKNPRKKDKNETDHLRGLIREKDKQIAALTRQIKYLEKREHLAEVLADEPEYEEPPKPQKRCDACGKGHYVEFEIANKCYGTCNICEDRKRLK